MEQKCKVSHAARFGLTFSLTSIMNPDLWEFLVLSGSVSLHSLHCGRMLVPPGGQEDTTSVFSNWRTIQTPDWAVQKPGSAPGLVATRVSVGLQVVTTWKHFGSTLEVFTDLCSTCWSEGAVIRQVRRLHISVTWLGINSLVVWHHQIWSVCLVCFVLLFRLSNPDSFLLPLHIPDAPVRLVPNAECLNGLEHNSLREEATADSDMRCHMISQGVRCFFSSVKGMVKVKLWSVWWSHTLLFW